MTKIKLEKFIYSSYYNVLVALFSIFAILITIFDYYGYFKNNNIVFLITDIFILLFFLFDYVSRLICAENKTRFIRNNLLDLIAIIPFNLFSFLRFIRIIRILRLLKFLRIFIFLNKFTKFFKTNGLIYLIYINLIALIIGATSIYLVEKGSTVNSFLDAIWWAFVTVTTVGYGDVSPKTTIGRLIACVLMLLGIGLISMLTGTIATYFTNLKKEELKTNELTYDEIIEVNKYIDFIKSKRQ